MDSNAVTLAQSSYRRCLEAKDFFARFYAKFFEECPEAETMFAATDFERQHRLLQHAIGLLLNFDRQPDTKPNILSRVAERHSRRDLAVAPALYPMFLDSLIDTMRLLDPDFTEETERAWRDATAKGIAYMQSRY